MFRTSYGGNIMGFCKYMEDTIEVSCWNIETHIYRKKYHNVISVFDDSYYKETGMAMYGFERTEAKAYNPYLEIARAVQRRKNQTPATNKSKNKKQKTNKNHKKRNTIS